MNDQTTKSQATGLPTAPQGAGAAGQRPDISDLLWLATLLAVFVALAAAFLPHQSIWVDETTQLSGIAMGPREVLTFLTGGHAPIGVPPDRNPPLSYWAGQAWCAVFGFSEHAMRWFGVTCVAGAIAAVYLTARRISRVAAIVAAAFLALSPTILTTSVEIRPYPLYLLLAALAFYMLGGILQREDGLEREHAWGLPLGLSLVLIAAIYTHFFGVILAGVVLAGWLGESFLRGRGMRQPLCVGCVVFLAAGGLYPFIHSANVVSGDSTDQVGWLTGLAKLPMHLLTHPALRLNGIGLPQATLPGLAFLATAALLILGLVHAMKVSAGRATVIGAAAGLVAITGAAVVVSKFNSLHPGYNLWIMPPTALLLGMGAATIRGSSRVVARGAAGMVVMLGAMGSIQWVRHATAFAHGAQNQVLALIDGFGPANVTFIQDASKDGHVPFGLLFPLRYHYHQVLQRYSVAMPATPGMPPQFYDDNWRTANPSSPAPRGPGPLPADLGRYVIVAQNEDLSGKDLASAIAHGPAPADPGPAVRLIDGLPGYRKVAAPYFVAMDAAAVTIFERADLTGH